MRVRPWTRVLLVVALASMVGALGPVSVPVASAPRGAACAPAQPSSCTLRQLADRAAIRFGATLEPAQIADPDYAATLGREFSSVTAENAMKWYATEPSRGAFDFTGADAVLQFADDHGQVVRGHNLVWAQDAYTPQWVKAISDPAELRAAMEDHIAAVMGRYRGRIQRWDVVNEPLASVGTGPSNSVFQRVLGPGWVGEAFRYAHQVDPDAELWLNEYGTDWVPGKQAALVALLRTLVAEGVPIDGVGFQTHRLSPDGPSPAAFEGQLREVAALGLKVAITELDVPVSPTAPDALDQQAEAYARIVRSCLAVPACEEVTTWGVTDADTWLDALGILPAPTRPLLFDDGFQPKPAYDAVRAVLAAGREGATTTTTVSTTATTTTLPGSTPEGAGSGAPPPSPATPVAAAPSFTG